MTTSQEKIIREFASILMEAIENSVRKTPEESSKANVPEYSSQEAVVDPMNVFREYLSSPMKVNETANILMKLYDNCTAFRKIVSENESLSLPLPLMSDFVPDVSRVDVSLKELTRIMPHVQKIMVSSKQLSLVTPAESYPNILVLHVNRTGNGQGVYRVDDLKSFPNIEFFASSGDCVFTNPSSPAGWISSTIKNLCLEKTERMDIDLRQATNLKCFTASPMSGGTFRVSASTSTIMLDLTHCKGHVDLHTEGFSHIEISGKHPKASIDVHIPKGCPRGTIDVDDYFRVAE